MTILANMKDKLPWRHICDEVDCFKKKVSVTSNEKKGLALNGYLSPPHSGIIYKAQKVGFEKPAS